MATKIIAWNTGTGNITLTYTGQGDGTVSVQSDDNNLGSARSQVVSIQTTNGAVTKNLTVNQAACPFPVNTVKSYSYTGSYQEVVLPAGQYKLQVWGAQGGSNGTNSTYGITAKAGGKGGYSEGIITLSQKTTVRVYVGGQGSSSAGGYNGGGSTTGTSQYNASNEFGYSKMGGGGGATDIRLSDGALLSRMIVAGGGSGGAMCYRSKTTTSTTTIWTFNKNSGLQINTGIYTSGSNTIYCHRLNNPGYNLTQGDVIKLNGTKPTNFYQAIAHFQAGGFVELNNIGSTYTVPSRTDYTLDYIDFRTTAAISSVNDLGNINITCSRTTSSTSTNTYSQAGYVGGGTNGGGYSSTYQGKQNAAGSGGSFGQGANQSITAYRYCSGAGGGGWYGGGGGLYSDSSTSYVYYSGGGSGWVNTSGSAGNRPSGYTGLQLDSGTTYSGSSSFPNTSGTGNETGHSGNGYAKITRLA